MYTLAEFFCGCGGTSRGFERTGRFRVVLGNDVKDEALRTFAHNHPGARVLREDIRLLSVDELDLPPLDVLVGGPPCQGFSQLKRQEHREKGRIVRFSGYSKLAEDPRNDLVLRFLELAEALRPRAVVIENVPQMLRHGFKGRLGKLSEVVVGLLEDMGYGVSVSVLNAADYGVPQLRERAIFVATEGRVPGLPAPSHSDPSAPTLGTRPWVTVREAIGDLPSPGERVYRSEGSDWARPLRSHVFPENHIGRSYSERVLAIVREMRPGRNWDEESERMRARYAPLVAERAAAGGLSEEQAREQLAAEGALNPVFYKRYYWSAYTRLAWDQPALTITANANFLGSGRFSHPDELRGITMREAARLQSFDDDFRIVTDADGGGERIGVGMDMIGEAVPPTLARAIGEHVAARLDEA